MSFLKSYQELRNHPKTRKLARKLGGTAVAVGTLHCLWWWCMDYAKDGNLTNHDPEDIAVACEWSGDTDELISALVDSGFLDTDRGLRIHDWKDWGGKWVMQMEAAKERAARHYANKRAKDAGSMRRERVVYAQSTHSEEIREEKKEQEKVSPNGLVALARSVEGWRERPDDEAFLATVLTTFSKAQVERVIGELSVYQAANHKYTDSRRALANWLNRRGPDRPESKRRKYHDAVEDVWRYCDDDSLVTT